jgi:hypothetical protein
MLPAPVQAAMTAALGDDEHVAAQRERYRARRDVLKPALEAAGFRIDHSEGGLYLWATEGRDAWATMAVSPSSASWPGRDTSTASTSRSTCASRSRRPTSASPPRRRARGTETS